LTVLLLYYICIIMGREKMDKDVDKLTQNYQEMDETGKEILEMTAAQFKKVWNSINEIKKRNVMSEQEINMWSILIAVLKNRNKNNYSINEIIDDIHDIKILIKTL
jgi:tRNA C32,U32 (ribose-2'-O)-methylase TrmJ